MGKSRPTRPRVYARLRQMFGRDEGKPELFTVGDSDTSLAYRKHEVSVVLAALNCAPVHHPAPTTERAVIAGRRADQVHL